MTKSPQLQFAITQFETAHPEYDIQLKDFSEQLMGMKLSGQAIDIGPMIQTLNTEMMSGAGPDIIVVDYLPYYKLITRGVLQDLGAMMDADKSFDRSLYYGNVLDACKMSGKLYTVPASFSFSVLASTWENSPGDGNVTMAQFLEKAKALPSGKFAFAKDDPLYIMGMFMRDNYYNFYDYETHKAAFDSALFIDILKDFKALIETKMSSLDREGNKDNLEQLRQETIAYDVERIRQVMDVAVLKSSLGPDGAITNLPVMGDADSYGFYTSDMLAINANSKNKDIAWQFIKTVLSHETQSNNDKGGFSILKSASQDRINSAANQQVLLDKDGKRATVRIGDTDVEIKPLTAGDIAWLNDRIGKLNRLSVSDDSIIKIIDEELPPFFAGQKTAEDVAGLIQNRVNTVLNE